MVNKFAYVLDLDKDLLVLTSKKRLNVPDIMFLMIEHGALGCVVYDTNFSEDMETWRLITTYGGVMTSF